MLHIDQVGGNAIANNSKSWCNNGRKENNTSHRNTKKEQEILVDVNKTNVNEDKAQGNQENLENSL